MRHRSFAILAALLLVRAAGAQTTWNGSTSSDWFDGTNWSAGVPGAGDDVTVPGSTPNAPLIGAGTAAARALVVDPGATLMIAGGAMLELADGASGGGVVAGGLVRFTGGGLIETITLPDVEVATAGTVTLTGFPNDLVDVTGDFTLTSGTLEGPVGNFQGPAVTAVAGDAGFLGGTLDERAGLFTVAGTTTLAGCDASDCFHFKCRGDWSSDATFAAATQTVTFDGTGTQTITAPGSVFFHVEIAAGSTVATAAALDVDGDLTVDGSLGVSTLSVAGDVTVPASASIAPGSVLTLDGGTQALTGQGAFPSVTVASSGSIALGLFPGDDLTFDGDLVLSSGTLDSPPSNFQGTSSLTVTGDASFVGGAMNRSPDGHGFIDVAGVVTFAGCDASDLVDVRCGGDWTSDATFAATVGGVTFTAAGTQTLDAPGSVFHDLVVAAGAQVTPTSLVDVDRDLVVNGTVGVSGISVARNVTVAAGGTITAGSMVLLDGVGTQLLTGQGTFASVLAASSGSVELGFSIADDLVLDGDLIVVSGTVEGPLSNFQGAATVSVSGDGSFLGGNVVGRGTVAVVDVDGDVTFDGCPTSGDLNVRCGGHWSSDGLLAAQGFVELDGGGLQSLSGDGPVFDDFRVTAGAAVDAQVDMHVTGDLDVDGVFSTIAELDVDGAFSSSAQSCMLLGFETHHFGGDVDLDGKLHAYGTVVLDGGGDVEASPISPFPRLELAGSAQRNVHDLICAELEHTSGLVFIAGTLRVLGDATMSGGEIRNFNGVLDVEGSVTFSGTLATVAPDIECGGDWSADASFAPTQRSVTFDGTGPQMISSLAPSDVLQFYRLFIDGADCHPGENLELTGLFDFQVRPGGVLDIDANRLDVAGLVAATMTVDGRLTIDAGGTLGLSAIAVVSNGALELLGAPGNRANVAGFSGGGYSFLINGSIAAADFSFTGMGAGGISLLAGAAIAAPPLDFRNGLFDQITPGPSATLLRIGAGAPIDVHGAVFENNGGNAAFNVQSLPGAAITMVNFGGAFGGPAFESDTLDLIAWTSAAFGLPAERPDGVVTVGAGGDHDDVRSALASLPPGDHTVVVEQGTYRSFTVPPWTSGSLRIVGDPAAHPVIDASGGPVIVSGVAAGASLEIAGLAIGADAAGVSLEVAATPAGVVLDDLVLQGTARLASVAGAVVQECDLAGTPSLRLDAASRAMLLGGQASVLEVVGGSRLDVAGLAAPPTPVVAPSSTLVVHAGAAMTIDAAPFARIGETIDPVMALDPTSPWALFAATAMSLLDAPPIVLFGVIDPAAAVLVADGTSDGQGGAATVVQVPDVTALVGLTLTFQAVHIAPAGPRWSSCRSVVLTP